MKQLISRERVNLKTVVPPEWEAGHHGVTKSLSSFPVVIQHMPANRVKKKL